MTDTLRINHELLMHKMQQKIFPTRMISVPERNIRHWQKLGLIDATPKNSNRKFNFLDCIWLQIISELRVFDIGLGNIKLLRNHLLYEKEKSGEDLLLNNSLDILETRVPVYILLGTDFKPTFLNDDGIAQAWKSKDVANHIVLNLNQIIRSCFIQLWDKPVFNDPEALSKEEVELLSLVRQKRFKSIAVKMKDGTIDMIEGVEKVDTEKRIIDLLKEGRFQNIEVKQENGKVVVVNRTIKKKL